MYSFKGKIQCGFCGIKEIKMRWSHKWQSEYELTFWWCLNRTEQVYEERNILKTEDHFNSLRQKFSKECLSDHFHFYFLHCRTKELRSSGSWKSLWRKSLRYCVTEMAHKTWGLEHPAAEELETWGSDRQLVCQMHSVLQYFPGPGSINEEGPHH